MPPLQHDPLKFFIRCVWHAMSPQFLEQHIVVGHSRDEPPLPCVAISI